MNGAGDTVHTDLRPTVEAPDDDPYLWLEDVEGAAALGWVAAQNAATLGRLADAAFKADRAALRAILDRPDNIPYVTQAGSRNTAIRTCRRTGRSCGASPRIMPPFPGAPIRPS